MMLVRPRRPSPYTAYLRVYEPLEAFPAHTRAAWAAQAAQESASADRLVAERDRSLVALLRVPPVPVPAEEVQDAFVLRVDDEPLVCPVQSRLRSWVALGEFRDGLPDTLLHAFLPPAVLDRADAEHRRWASDDGARLSIRTATWAVPIHWFVAFEDGEAIRALEGDLSLVYRTGISAARRRVARALRTLSRLDGDDGYEIDYVAELEELARWLEEFHSRSWVELDYAGLPHLMGADWLRTDRSVADVGAALTALAAGDQDSAAAVYETLVERWAAVNAFEHAN
jgi:hypothetical protein